MAQPSNFVSTLTEVANLALSKLGENEEDLLTDIDTDTGEIADKTRRFIYQVIRNVQSEFLWDEIYERVNLETPETDYAQASDEERALQGGWGYRYALPDDYLRPTFDDGKSYEIRGGFVYCDYEENYPFEYVKYSEDPTEWSSVMLKAIWYSLAIELCLPITESDDKYASLLQEFEAIVMPRLERTGSYSKKYRNSRYSRQDWGRTRGRRNVGGYYYNG